MIFFDAHLHVYPEYGLDAFLSSLSERARKAAPDAACVAGAVMLRQFQPDLGTALNAAGKPREWRLIPPEENGRPWVASHGDGRRILLFPARQVAARERLELLGFFGESPVPDGLPLADAALALQSAGFTSALAWGRGKWLFGRAVLVRRFLLDPALRRAAPFVCDSALRPRLWLEPLFRTARLNGFAMLSGSDPLPGAGNERNAGRRAMLLDAPAPPQSAAALIALLSRGTPLPR